MNTERPANEYQIGGSHYSQAGNYQHWDFVESFRIGYLESLATKYLIRWDKKGIPVQDLQKSIHTMTKLIQDIQGKGRTNRADPVPATEVVRLFCSANDVPNLAVGRAIELLYRWQAIGEVLEARDLIVAILEEQPSHRIMKMHEAKGKGRASGQESPFGYDAKEEGVLEDGNETKGTADRGGAEEVRPTAGEDGVGSRQDPSPASGQDPGGTNSGTDGGL